MVDPTSRRTARRVTSADMPEHEASVTREVHAVGLHVDRLSGLVDELADQVYELRLEQASPQADDVEPHEGRADASAGDHGDDSGGGGEGQDSGTGTGSASGTAGLYGSRVGANMLVTSVAEAVGTLLLVLAGTSVAVAASQNASIAGGGLDSLAVAVAFGFALVALVTSLGHVSGCHVNPAVTIGLAVTGRFPWKFVPAHVGAQLLGAVGGALIVWGSFGDVARDKAQLGAPNSSASFASAFLVEAVITFFLVLVVISVATDDRVPTAGAGAAVGFALGAAVLIGGPITGGSVNPARALGPMLVSGQFPLLGVYLLAPIVGGIAAALLYGRLLDKADAP